MSSTLLEATKTESISRVIVEGNSRATDAHSLSTLQLGAMDDRSTRVSNLVGHTVPYLRGPGALTLLG